MVKEIKTEALDAEVNVNDFLLGRTPIEKQVLFKATNGVLQEVEVTRKINLGNFESLGIGFTLQIPLGMSEEELEVWEDLTREAVQSGINILNEEMDKRVAKARAALRAT